MNLKVKKMSRSAKLPTRGSDGAAGWDLYSNKERAILPKRHVTFTTGIAIELPEGTFGAIYPRSGLATENGLRLCNCVGVIDEDYRGEIKIPIYNDSGYTQRIGVGDRIAQLVIQPYCKDVELEVVKKLSETERGVGGFGSTGV